MTGCREEKNYKWLTANSAASLLASGPFRFHCQCNLSEAAQYVTYNTIHIINSLDCATLGWKNENTKEVCEGCMKCSPVSTVFTLITRPLYTRRVLRLRIVVTGK